MNAREAKRALEVALLEAVVAKPHSVTVYLAVCVDTEHEQLQLQLTAEDVQKAAQRQLAALKPPPSTGDMVRRYATPPPRHCPHGYLLSELADGTSTCEPCELAKTVERTRGGP
jgi:hypothetical protein